MLRAEGVEYVDGCEFNGCEFNGCEFDSCEFDTSLIEKSDGLIRDSWVTARLVTGAVRLKDEALLRVSD